jgi:hypothetical protein
MIPGASRNQETQKYSFPWIARYLSARNLKHAKSKQKNKNQSETTLPMYNKLENCHHTFCKLIDSSKTDLQPFLDDENRYMFWKEKREEKICRPEKHL